MRKERYLPVSEFARISGVSRQRLIYYDNIGIFKPALVRPNGYRYYAHWQVETITVICILSELGVSLDEIREYLQNYGPERALELLEAQDAVIEQKIQRLQQLQELLHARTRRIREAPSAGSEPQIIWQERTPLFLSAPFHCDNSELPDELWVRFYDATEACGIPFCYPACYLVRREDLMAEDYHMVSHLCYRLPGEKNANGFLTAGRYLTGYRSFHYGDTAPLYRQLYRYAQENGLEIGGDACEEYLLDELAVSSMEKYRVKVQILLKN